MGNKKSKPCKAPAEEAGEAPQVVEEQMMECSAGGGELQASLPPGQNMAGLVKPKKYDWKDSNMALVGSKLDKEVKKESAATEPAWSEVLKTSEPALFVWRIEKFEVKPLPKEDYGNFFSGDSYIVLNCYKTPGEDDLKYDVHFWIGKRSTQDEYGTAAYKTVELDTLLDDKAVQYREVQDYETEKFKSYFKSITVLKGGIASGFRHVEPTKYEPRLLSFKSPEGKTIVEVREVFFSRRSLTSGDVYILDAGLEAWQWNGASSSGHERLKAAQFLQQLEGERNGRLKNSVIEEGKIDEEHPFWKLLPDKEQVKKTQKDLDTTKRMFKLSDAEGRLKFDEISNGTAPKAKLDNKDVFVIDTCQHLYVYVGSDCSRKEKQNAIRYAHQYLQGTKHPMIGVTCVKSAENAELQAVLD